MSQYFSDSVFPALDHKREDNQEIRYGVWVGEGQMVDPFVALCFSGGSARLAEEIDACRAFTASSSVEVNGIVGLQENPFCLLPLLGLLYRRALSP